MKVDIDSKDLWILENILANMPSLFSEPAVEVIRNIVVQMRTPSPDYSKTFNSIDNQPDDIIEWIYEDLDIDLGDGEEGRNFKLTIEIQEDDDD